MNIEKKIHLNNLLGSLNKMFINAKTKGVIRNKELYLLNVIHNVLNACSILTDKERKQLIEFYFNLLNRYSFLCKNGTELKAFVQKNYIHENYKINPVYSEQGDIISEQDEETIFTNEFNNIFS